MIAFILQMEENGERDKLEELYLLYSKELYYVAYRILHNYHDAQDVMQNAFVKISKHLDKIEEIKCKKTRAYLVIIVRNLCYDKYREKKKVVPMDIIEQNEKEVANDISLDDYVLNLERGKEMANALGKIHPRYADILTLKYYYEYTNQEISELLDLTSDNVSVKLHRAKAALKKLLSEGGAANE